MHEFSIPIAIITGGTAGHVLPGCALSILLKCHIFIEKSGSKYTNIDHFFFIFQNKWNPFLWFKAIIGNMYKLRNYNTIIGFGAFMTLPHIMAGWILGLHLYVHESNAVLGRANRIAQFLGATVLTSFQKTKYAKKPILFGIPISHRRIETIPQDYILVLAGSGGSKFFDTYVVPVLINISSTHNIPMYIQTKAQINHPLIITSDFFHNFQDLLAGAKLTITRAGSSTLAYIKLYSKNSILIPLINSRDNHQLYNAQQSNVPFIEEPDIMNNVENFTHMILNYYNHPIMNTVEEMIICS